MNLGPEMISKIRIDGFKSIEHCDLSLNRINVLIGSNGAGKSNFISFFVMLQNILSHNLAVFVGQSGLDSLFFNGRKQTSEISAEIFFGSNSYGFDLVPTDDNRLIFRQEYFGYHGRFENTSLVSSGHSESLWHKGVSNNLSQYVVPILEQQSWRVYHFHDTSRFAPVKTEHNLANDKFLTANASNLAAFLYRLRKNFESSYFEILESIRLIAPFFDDFELEPNESNPEKIVLKWKQKGCEDIFNASQLSDGTLRFICLATLLLQPVELQPVTIIVDEPELGLQPYAIAVFAEMVKRASYRKQIIISTQSVEMLNEFDVEDVVVVNRDQERSVFQRLDADELRDWLDNDYSLGELWNKNVLGGRLSL